MITRRFLGPVLMVLLLSTTGFNPKALKAQTVSAKKYLPSVIQKVKFGASLKAVMKSRKKIIIAPEQKDEFRTVCTEAVNDNGITSIVYYFDNDGDRPLYEIIVNYETAEYAGSNSSRHLKNPNYKEVEWKYSMSKGFALHAWVYKNKIVYVIPFKGTEWEGAL